MSKAHLGDGVYVDVERGMIKLTTENGVTATNTIFLDGPVMSGLFKYAYGAEFTSSLRVVLKDLMVSGMQDTIRSQVEEIDRLKSLLAK